MIEDFIVIVIMIVFILLIFNDKNDNLDSN